jgi:ADP-heptose:LPS heptosyltransferase
LHTEQGFGDTIQFIRYALFVKKRNPLATVIVECERRLGNLLARCPGIDHLISKGDDLPLFDVHSPLLSLPNLLKTTLATIPDHVPYVFADPILVAHWRNRLNPYSGLRIGINWEGRSGPGEHLKRNIPLDFFAELGQRIAGITFVSLQKRATATEIIPIDGQVPIVDVGPDFDTKNGAFADSAAIMMNLDLVISSDTSVPHLAGALGIPAWLALPYVPDWRWLLNREDSPWYPTLRLFRQKSPGDWSGVFDAIRLALRKTIPPLKYLTR